jgi:hypothetical protein
MKDDWRFRSDSVRQLQRIGLFVSGLRSGYRECTAPGSGDRAVVNCYCYIRDRLSWVSEADREAIRRFASKHGTLRAADEAMRLLGWSSPEAIAAAMILRGEEPKGAMSD